MAEDAVLNVMMLTPDRVIFEGRAASLVLPGERGVFEILPHHKPLLSRLLEGRIFIGSKDFPIRRGVMRVSLNKVVIVVEE